MKLCSSFCSDRCHQESVVLQTQRLDRVMYWQLLSFLVPCQPLFVLGHPEEEERSRRGGGEEDEEKEQEREEGGDQRGSGCGVRCGPIFRL